MRRIFITGCARSGTTLLGRLFYAFADTQVIDPEISIDAFCDLASDKSFLVAKRTPLTILSVPLPEAEMQRQWSLVDSYGIRIVNIIRDGRDVAHQHPTGPRVNVNRWIGCILQAQRFRERISLEVRYEDLVREADKVQSQLIITLGLQPKAKFSEYPEFVPDRVFAEPEYRDFPPYRKRPIDQASIAHAPLEYFSDCFNSHEQQLFGRTLQRLGYLNASPQQPWRAETLAQESQIFRELSRLQGYNCC